MDGPFVRQIISVILVEAAERYEPGAGFYVNVVIGFMPHISERFRPTLALLSQLCDQCQVFLIIIAVLLFLLSSDVWNRQESESASQDAFERDGMERGLSMKSSCFMLM